MGNAVYSIRAQSLKQLGFANYGQYLDSAKWKTIRQMVLVRDGFWCRKCGKSSAHHIHHSSYDLPTLEGKDLSRLHSVCDWCHREIEFEGDDKRDGDKATAFNQWLPATELPDGNLKRKARKTKKRFTKPEKVKLSPEHRRATEKQAERIRTLVSELGIPLDAARVATMSQADYQSWNTDLERRLKDQRAKSLRKAFQQENRRFK